MFCPATEELAAWFRPKRRLPSLAKITALSCPTRDSCLAPERAPASELEWQNASALRLVRGSSLLEEECLLTDLAAAAGTRSTAKKIAPEAARQHRGEVIRGIELAKKTKLRFYWRAT